MQKNASSLLNITRNFAKYPCCKSAERLRNIWNKEVVSIYFFIGLIFLSRGLTQFLLYKKQLLHTDVFLSSYISSMKSKTATIFVSGNECLFLSTSFFLALLHGGSVPIIVGTMNNYVNFLFEIKTQPGVLLRPKR